MSLDRSVLASPEGCATRFPSSMKGWRSIGAARLTPMAPALEGDATVKVRVVSYAHGCCRRAQRRNRQSALDAEAASVHALRYQHLLEGSEFARRHAQILRETRGSGLWIWKPLAISWALKHANRGDIVVYLDAGNRFQSNVSLPLQTARLLANSDVAAWRISCCLERHWTSRCVIDALGAASDAAIVDTEQVTAGFVLLRRTELAERFVAEWLAATENHTLLKGECGGVNFPGFCEHRADQSLFSLLFKRYGFHAFSDSEVGSLVSFDRDLF